MSIPPEYEASPTTPEFLSGGGEMGGRIRAVDWSQTALGPVEGWPAALASTLGVCLSARFPMAIYWGRESVLLYNDAWRPILGDKHPWGLGRPAREVWPEIWDAIAPLLTSVLTTGEATWRGDELLAMQRFGYTEECYFDYSFNPIWGQSGGVEGILNVVQETTYRLLNERRARLLRELAARSGYAKSERDACTAAVSALATDPADIPFALLYLVEPDGRRAWLVEATGLPGDSPARTEVVDLSAETARDGWPLADAFRSGSEVTVDDLAERFGTLPSGFWPEYVSQALVLPVGAAGTEGAAALLIVGVNPRRPLDDDYRHFFGLVASHVATALNNARAYEEEKRRAEALAEIDRAKTLFFSNVSHELRTPLTLMLSPLEETLAGSDGRLSPEDREQLSLVHRNGLRLLKLVNTLLDFSRIEAGRAQAVYEPVDLAAYTSELASVFRSAVESAGLRLVVNCPPLPQPVYVDREMWEKVVLNLLSNAFKFTLEGEIEVSLGEADGRVELHVRDTGTGIPPEEIAHVFERFHRVKGSRGRTHEGTGIGLALVQELVKLHGGSVKVESVYGRGTTFTILLPQGSAHLPQERIEGARTLASTSLGATPFVEEVLRWLPPDAARAVVEGSDYVLDPPSGDGLSGRYATYGARVLLADDNADMREYVRRLLERWYVVEAASDGQAALDAARERAPDLVLSDVMMPRLDGFGLLRELRNDPRLKTVPVILLSARAGEESRVEGLEAGADDYLVKPFSARELLARVRANLEMARLRREFTRELEAAHARNEEILASISDAFFAFDREWRYVYLNDRAVEMARKPREELLGRSVWEVFPDLAGSRMDTEWNRAARTGVPVTFEFNYVPYDAWLEHHVYPTPEGVTVFITDIGGRKRAEEGLRYQSQLTRNIAQTAAVSIFVTDDAGHTVFMNREAEKVFGYTPDEIAGRNLHDAIHYRLPEGGPYPMSECPLGRVYRGGEAVRDHEDEFYRKDGSPVAVICSNAPIVEGGRTTGVVLTVLDITERKRAEQERERLLREAQEANRLKDEFLATVSHELRTPLTAILGWTHLLRTGQLDEASAARALETVERNARSQNQLVEDLLDMSRVITGKLRLDIRPCEPSVFIEAAVEAVRPAAEAKGVRLQKTFDTGVGAISGDAERLQQVVWNLLSNAIKFTPRGGRVQVRLERVNSHVEVVVTDTGAGIAQEFLPHVFDRFRQADMGTTRRHGGLGLGLAIVRHFVEMHGGTVEADSHGEGQGATFTVKLPLIPVYQREATQERVHARAGGDLVAPLEYPDRLDGLKVLVVDDEADTGELLGLLLTRNGAEVTMATSAEDALAELGGACFDLLVSDIGMPGVDGYELIRRVRELPAEQGGRIPAVALTAYARAEDRLRALRGGYQMHVAKPVEPAELIAVMASLAGRPRTDSPL